MMAATAVSSNRMGVKAAGAVGKGRGDKIREGKEREVEREEYNKYKTNRMGMKTAGEGEENGREGKGKSGAISYLLYA
jgi:hypothetical protein